MLSKRESNLRLRLANTGASDSTAALLLPT